MEKILRTRVTVLVLFAFLALPALAPAGVSAGVAQPDRFSRAELTRMLSPIALYPDSLLAQVLMAATYPLEIVEAERWLRRNEGLQGEALVEALRAKSWDTSVKSLCHFPDLLFALSEELEQTRNLGDAWLAQEDEVAAVVQELRRKARERGNLETTREQKVIVEREIIRIVPASPRVVYVPVYDPFYVYGPWSYPAPPYYWYRPPGRPIRYQGVSFGLTVRLVSGWFFSWTWFDWPASRIYVAAPVAVRYHERVVIVRDSAPGHWRHDPRHRRGVAYRDPVTVARFSPPPVAAPPPRPPRRAAPPSVAVREDVPGRERVTARPPGRAPDPPEQVSAPPAPETAPPRTAGIPRVSDYATPSRGWGDSPAASRQRVGAPALPERDDGRSDSILARSGDERPGRDERGREGQRGAGGRGR